MSKRFISMELVFGAAVLLIIGVASSMATNQTVAKISRDECIEQVVDFLEQVEIDDQVEARLEYARNLYFEKRLPWNKYLVYPAPAGCMRLKGLMSSVGSAVPCFSDISVMGESDLQNELELIRASKGAKRALEAEVACSVAYHAGEVLRGKKWFKTIVTPYEIKGEINRDECIKAAVAFFEEIPIDDHVKARVEYVRQYYYTEMDFNGYIPHCPEICDVFLRKLYNFREVVPCWQSELIMGKDMKDENLLAAINAGERTKLVIEAWFACQQDQYTGQLMRKRGVFNAIVGRS